LTQEQLAERAGLSYNAIAALERGRRQAPRRSTLALLVAALNIGPVGKAALEAAAFAAHDDSALRMPSDDSRLPIAPTRLIGRDEEVSATTALLQQLAPDVRLLTLVGPGGVGKTRLALATAGAVAGEYADGVVFVELAPLRDERLVAATVARALGLRELPGASARVLLLQHLRERQILLVLDNFEHLLGAAQLVAELLASCPRLRFLVTSRAPLRVRAEHLRTVPPLVTRASPEPTMAELAALPAVQLFAERAQVADAGFVLGPENVATVAELCARLDGLPLTIELAAARVAVLPPAALLQHLDQRIPLLVGGARDLPPRQQTLRATLDWSYALLSPAAQLVLARLSVFDGGGTMEAAQQVACTTLDVLGELADSSLLAVVAVEDEARFDMLETVRLYAAERLYESGGAPATLAARDAFYAGLTSQAERALIGPEDSDQERWIKRLERDQANVRAWMHYALDRGQVDDAADALWRVHGFLWSRGSSTELRVWADELHARKSELSPRAQSRVAYMLGLAASMQSDGRLAMQQFAEALAGARAVEDHRTVGLCLLLLAYTPPLRVERATAMLHESAAHFREAADAWGEAFTVAGLGEMALATAQPDLAETYFAEYVHRSRSRGDLRGLGQGLQALGMAVLLQGDSQRAAELLTEGCRISRRTGNFDFLARGLRGLGCVAAARHQWALTGRMLAAADGLALAPAVTRFPTWEQLVARTLADARNHLGARNFAVAEARGRDASLDDLMHEAAKLAQPPSSRLQPR
jgi:predicted ATPase